jgi:chemotaxis protein histidine kinase CheA
MQIDDDYSPFLEELLETSDIEGASMRGFFIEALALPNDIKSTIESVIYSTIGSPIHVFELNEHLLPLEAHLVINNRSRLVQLEWVPISGKNSIIEKVLVSIRDVTRLRELEHEARRQAEEFEYLKEVAASGSRFVYFAKTADRFMSENRAAIASQGTPDLRHMHINLHTLKGLSRSIGLSALSSALHEAESHLVPAQETPSMFAAEQCLKDLDTVATILKRYWNIYETNLVHEAEPLQIADFGFTNQDLVSLLTSIQDGEAVRDTRLYKILAAAFFHDNRKVTLELASQANASANDREKTPPLIAVEGDEVLLTPKGYELLSNIIPHLIANSIAHGIEDPEIRFMTGKPTTGQVSLKFQVVGAHLVLSYSDDGRGLDLDEILRQAEQQGIQADAKGIRPERQQIAELIFHSGLTTATTTNEIAGRGVGMDAVKFLIEGAGGRIKLRLANEEQAVVPFTLAIELPEDCYFRPIPVAKAALSA